ncbi:MAG TPA: hypothetical protein VFU05_14470 [Cyclobacteriaceae bacterium]|nr:hypothetical protein [Cyclobacteriaceae bacterium]
MKLITFLLFMNLISNQEALTDFKFKRIQRSATFTIHGKVENVFPLFGPIREKDWAEGWNPEILYKSGNVLVEEHMIFQTNAPNGKEKFTWVITQFQPEKYLIEYTVSTRERIWFIRVTCQGQKETTGVTVSYTYIGLTPEGHQKNEEALKQMFVHDLKDWQEAINYYLQTGKCLTTKTHN